MAKYFALMELKACAAGSRVRRRYRCRVARPRAAGSPVPAQAPPPTSAPQEPLATLSAQLSTPKVVVNEICVHSVLKEPTG